MPKRRGVVLHPTSQTPLENVPALPVEDAFKDEEIICLICGKGGMKTLAPHLNFMHNMRPGQYRKLFGLKKDKPLTSKNYSEVRRRFADEKVTPESLAKARAERMASSKDGNRANSFENCRQSGKRSYNRRHIFIGTSPE